MCGGPLSTWPTILPHQGRPCARYPANRRVSRAGGPAGRLRPMPTEPAYLPAADRYQVPPYRRTGRSGLVLPAVSLGLWHNFGDDRPLDAQRAILRRAFDRGVTHFDLA